MFVKVLICLQNHFSFVLNVFLEDNKETKRNMKVFVNFNAQMKLKNIWPT